MRKSFLTTLKADPSTVDLPRSASGGGFGIPTFKPFQVPSSSHLTTTRSSTSRSALVPGKKRERVYSENDFYNTGRRDGGEGGGDGDFDFKAAKKAKKAAAAAAAKAKEDDSEDDKKKKGGFVDKYVAPLSPRKFPVYKPKPPSKVFQIPGMKKKGVILENKLTGQALGVRRKIDIPPRPLWDPLEDHAIVLWDPTVDDRDAEREALAEREAREKSLVEPENEEEKERNKVHRSLAEILGLESKESQKKRVVKVPVVIDPRVGKVLRPHQVEGVKFLYKCVTGGVDENAFG